MRSAREQNGGSEERLVQVEIGEAVLRLAVFRAARLVDRIRNRGTGSDRRLGRVGFFFEFTGGSLRRRQDENLRLALYNFALQDGLRHCDLPSPLTDDFDPVALADEDRVWTGEAFLKGGARLLRVDIGARIVRDEDDGRERDGGRSRHEKRRRAG